MTRQLEKNNESPTSDFEQKAIQEFEQKAIQESLKLRYDIYKHLTTLCTGSILLLISFLDKIFERPVWKGFVIAALCLFLISTLASLFVMHVIASTVQYMETHNKYGKRDAAVIVVALLSFLLGIVSLIIFAAKNLGA